MFIDFWAKISSHFLSIGTPRGPKSKRNRQIILERLEEKITPAVFLGSGPITINDATLTEPGVASPYPSEISITGLAGVVADINVTLTDVTHDFAEDMDILLVAPDGQSILLASDVSDGQSITSLTWTFDDDAPSVLPSDNNLTSGIFKPTNYVGSGTQDSFPRDFQDTFPAPAPGNSPTTQEFSAFYGSDPNGTWQLFVVDDLQGNSGTIGGWSLEITTAASSLVLNNSGNLVFDNWSDAENTSLTIQSDTVNSQYVITDLNETIATNIPGAIGNGTQTVFVPFSAVTGPNILFRTRQGNDNLTVDFSKGDFAKIIDYRGGGPRTAPGDRLILTGGDFNDVDYDFDGPDEGSVTLDGNEIQYRRLEAIASEVTTKRATLNYSQSSESITVAENDLQTRFSSTSAVTLDAGNPDNRLTITGGDSGDDTITVNGFGTGNGGFHATLRIEGETGTDEVVLNTPLILGTDTQQGRNLNVISETIKLNASVNTDGGAKAGNMTLDGNVVLGINVTLDAASTEADGTIKFQGTTDGPFDLSIITSNKTTFVGPVGANTPLQSLATDGSGTTTFQGGVVATSGDQLHNDAVTLEATTALSAATLVFNSTLNSLGSEHSLNILNGVNDVTFGGAVGDSLPLSGLTQTGGVGTTTFHTTIVNGPVDVATDEIKVLGSVTSQGPVALTAQNAITLDALLDAGSETIIISANQDGIGTENFSQNADGNIQTTNQTNNAVTITVGGSGDALVGTVALKTVGKVIEQNLGIDANGTPFLKWRASDYSHNLTNNTLQAIWVDEGDGTLRSDGPSEPEPESSQNVVHYRVKFREAGTYTLFAEWGGDSANFDTLFAPGDFGVNANRPQTGVGVQWRQLATDLIVTPEDIDAGNVIDLFLAPADGGNAADAVHLENLLLTKASALSSAELTNLPFSRVRPVEDRSTIVRDGFEGSESVIGFTSSESENADFNTSQDTHEVNFGSGSLELKRTQTLTFDPVDLTGFTDRYISVTISTNSDSFQLDDTFSITLDTGSTIQTLADLGKTELDAIGSTGHFRRFGGKIPDGATSATLIVDHSLLVRRVFLDEIHVSGVQVGENLVTIQTNGGSILDANGSSINVLADNLILNAGGDVGTSADGFESVVVNLEGSAGAGFYVSNSGSLVVGDIAQVDGINAGGEVAVTTTGHLTVSENVVGANVSLAAVDGATTKDDVVIKTGTLVQSNGDLNLKAGDNVSVDPGATLTGDAVTIAGDFGNEDVGLGTTINIQGTINSSTQGQVVGTNDNDFIHLSPESSDAIRLVGLGGDDHYLVDMGNLQGEVEVFEMSGEGTDTLIVSGTANNDTFTITVTEITETGLLQTVSYTDALEFLELQTQAGDDTLLVSPNQNTNITVDGGEPTGNPGDTLSYVGNGQPVSFFPDQIVTVGSKPIHFVNWEHFQFVGTDPVLNGTADDDLLEVNGSSTNAGSFRLTTDFRTAPVVGPEVFFEDVSSFRFDGRSGDDRLQIHNNFLGLFGPSNGLAYDGGSDAGLGDELVILDGSGTDLLYAFANSSDGMIVANGNQTIDYSKISSIRNTMELLESLFELPSVSDQAVLRDHPVSDDGLSELRSNNSTFTPVTFKTPTQNLTLRGKGGADILDVAGLDTQNGTLTPDVNVFGNGGGDTIVVSATGLPGSLSINGNAKADVVNFTSGLHLGSGSTNGDLSVIAETINLGNFVNTLSGTSGNVVFDASSQLTITPDGDINANGMVKQVGGGGVLTAGDISTTNDDISFLDSVILTGDVVLDSGTGDITFQSSVDDDGISTTSSILRNNSSGVTQFLSAIGATQPLTSLSTDVGGTTKLYADVNSQDKTEFNDPVSLFDDVAVNTTGSSGIYFNNTVDSDDSTTPRKLTAVATSTAAAIQFSQTIGTVPLSSLEVNHAGSGLIEGTLVGGGTGLIKKGAGTLTLSANNTYTGTTSIESGELLLTGALLGSGSDITLENSNTAFTGNNQGTVENRAVVVADGVTNALIEGLAKLTKQNGVAITIHGAGTVKQTGVQNSAVGIQVTGEVVLGQNTISNNTVGVLVDNALITFDTNNEISGGTDGLVVTGTQSSIGNLTLQNTAFANQSNDFVRLENGALGGPEIIDATAVLFDVGFGPTPGSALGFVTLDAVEAKLTHFPDDDAVGLLLYKTKVAYMENSNLLVIGSDAPNNILVDSNNLTNVFVSIDGLPLFNFAAGTFDLQATQGRVIVFGLDGTDFITITGAVDSEVNAGKGNDFVVGGWGHDVLRGQEGNDYLSGGGGNDILLGGIGMDTILGDQGDDILVGGESKKSFTQLQQYMDLWRTSGSNMSVLSGLVSSIFDPGHPAEMDLFSGGIGQDAFLKGLFDMAADVDYFFSGDREILVF
ncbi:MAG: autotransporter-associated beta strand repeat-containing protein [Gemmataceae bacterium]